MLIPTLQERLRAAVSAVLPDADPARIQVRPCSNAAHGDYETVALMALAKERKLNPRQLATGVQAKFDGAGLCEKVEISGAGFLNFRLLASALGTAVAGAARGEHLFVAPASRRRTVVIDFSSPNVAKPLHVGHIRSTFLGDCLQRVFRFLGHRVVTDNHIGDWGTQFGLLLVAWKTQLDAAALQADPIAEMERLYTSISAAAKADPAIRDVARAELVKLQSGDADNLGIWREMQRLSQSYFDRVYQRLGVTFDHALGESFYNPRLQGVVDELVRLGIARESEGAKGVFSDGAVPQKEDPYLVQNREGVWEDFPFLVQKSDGGFNYATTDLATVAYRLETWAPDEILYVTGAPQIPHFRQLFATFRRWHPAAKVRLEHVWFGSILGDDGKPMKTRDGQNIKLTALLDEALEKELAIVREKNPDLPEAAQLEIARQVSLGAVKYADLLPNRDSDYKFSWDKMLSLTGNTAPYLLYQYTRTRSVRRKGGESQVADPLPASLTLTAPEELHLARHLLGFGPTLEAVISGYRPNYLCNYLYELASRFSQFWEKCPVLKAEDPVVRASRAALADVSGSVLQQGLRLLGIETLERM